MAFVIVDAENTRRSRWPNVSREQLVRQAREWAGREGHEVLLVFDGEPPEQARDLVGARNADDAIVELAAGLDRPWWLVSSDRALRARLGEAPARIIGGGSFIREIERQSAATLGSVTRLFALSLTLLVLAASAEAADGGYASTVRQLSPSLQKTLAGMYWKPGCPVPLSDLRVLTVRHWDFAGNPRTGQLIVHRGVADPLRAVFRRLYEERFAIRYMQLDIYRKGDRLPANGDVSGSFECRKSVPSPCVGGTASGRWSNHAYGLAIDLNPRENPYVGCGKVRNATRRSYLDRHRLRTGMVTPAVVRAFRSIGWGWGGDWAGETKDYMHFSATGN